MYKFVHQPGAGATTIAMHVLWKLRDEFRCIKIENLNPIHSTDIVDKIIGNYLLMFYVSYCLTQESLNLCFFIKNIHPY
jgi:hypothetical protein